MKLLSKIQIIIILFFISLYAVVYVVRTNDKNEQVKFILEQQIKNLKNNYKVSTHRFEFISNNLYSIVLNQPEIVELFYKAKHAKTEAQRKVLRQKLYDKVKPYLQQLNKLGVKIILFAFEDNRTFLRVHKPSKHSDNLSDTRYSFGYVNEKKEVIRGFEQGKISHAFRNIFPMYYANEYIGSVDIAFSSEVLQENMISLHGINTHFIVDKTLFDANIYKAQKQVRYIQSIEHEKFLFALTPAQPDANFPSEQLQLNKALKDEIYENIKHNGSFSLYGYSDGKVQIITFLPIKNIEDKKTVAYLISYTHSHYLQNVLQEYTLINILLFIGLMLLSFLITSNVRHRFYLQMRVDEEVKKNRLQDKQLLEQSKIAQEKLNKSITLFGKNVIASSADISGKIIYASQAFCDISEFTQEELIGNYHNITRHPDMPDKLFKELWRTIKSEKVWKGEIKNLKKDGGFYWVKVSIMPDYDSEGKHIGYTSVMHDITPQKVKEEFMANMSHELRTPLNAIIGFSGILKKKLNNKSDNELVKQISSSAISLLTLINDILDLSKIQDSKFTIEPYEFNAYDEMLEYSKCFEGLTAKKELIYKISISKNLQADFIGDWLRISQIILNLISNSIKFTAEKGEISYSADYINGSLVLSISDNGIGMSKEVQDKIFKPFEQADGSTTRKYGGTGLGLSITQNLVELMNGKIELNSQEDVGSTFTITIPLEKLQNTYTDSNTTDSVKEEIERENFSDLHILVVEDNKTNQMLIKMLLAEFGITCDMANDGLEAVEMYNPDTHALILMDENMPNMNGVEAMKLIREKHQERCGAIIAITANAMTGDREKFLKLGMDGYISKPIDEDELYNTIKNLLL